MAAGPVRPSRQDRGRQGEDEAARHLAARGYEILARNWRRGSYELDLVCRQGDEVVFVEVKTRGPGSLMDAAEALTPAKRAALVRAASLWLSEHDAWELPARFDLVAVTATGGTFTLAHYQNVIVQGME